MKIALVGNPNSGKTTLFNVLTGLNAKIGNWPGVTIEKKTGYIKETNYEIVDLPGIYSLSPYSVEEEIARNFILQEKPNIIINIIDATALERSMYLTTQLLELDCKIIVVLNMTDKLSKKGLEIDVKKLSQELGTKVVQISALKETGIEELISLINEKFITEKSYIYDYKIERAILKIENKLQKEISNKRFISVKILELDRFFQYLNTIEIYSIIKETKKEYSTDLEEIIATQRYNYIEKVKKETVKQKQTGESITDKLDKILLNKWFSFLIFVVIMFIIYYLSVGLIGRTTVDWVTGIIDKCGNIIGQILLNYGTPEWLYSLITDGVISGVGVVLGFIPQLIILFVSISVLEATGYMSRIALLLDTIFRKIGLSGKSLIPFIIGAGCSVPAIMGSRIIENEDERKMTAILTTFIPCSAKLPIIALFVGTFFPNNTVLVSFSLYFFAIVIIIFSAILMKKFVFTHTSSTYISELPEYQIPDVKYIAKDVWDKVKAFIKRAGSTILVCSIVLWFLLSFSFSLEYGVNIENSILANIGNKISWIFKPILGVNSWEATVSAIQGLVAKEQVVSSMAVIEGVARNVEDENQIFNANGVFGFFTKASSYAYMVFNLFSAPCFGAIAAMKKEIGGTKKVLQAITFQTVLAWCLATIVYQIGIRIELGIINIPILLVVMGISGVIYVLTATKIKNSNLECAQCPYNTACNKK